MAGSTALARMINEGSNRLRELALTREFRVQLNRRQFLPKQTDLELPGREKGARA